MFDNVDLALLTILKSDAQNYQHQFFMFSTELDDITQVPLGFLSPKNIFGVKMLPSVIGLFTILTGKTFSA